MSTRPTDLAASPPPVAPNKSSKPVRSHQRNASTNSLASVRTLSENGGVQASPLKQVNSEPIKHEPKVVSLYNQLFSKTSHHPGYWVEFFLLKVNKIELARVLAANPQNFVRDPGLTTLHTLVRAAVANLSADLPADIVVNALQVLTVVVSVTLDLQGSGSALSTSTTTASSTSNNTKLSPRFSVIQALAGLDHASTVFDELTSRLLALLYLKNRTQVGEAVGFLLQTARKLWGSQISGLFTTKNFFAALIAIIDDKIDDDVATNALTCIGVLTGVNAYDDDTAAIYKQRLNDYVDEAVMTKILALTQQELLSRDQPNGTSNHSGVTGSTSPNSVFGWVSKWFSDPQPSSQSDSTASYAVDRVILPLYLFTVYNAVFSSQFAVSPALPTLIESSVKSKNFCVTKATSETALASSRTWLSLLAMRNLVDNDFLAITDPTFAAVMRLHSSKLVLDSSRRLPLAGILDFTVLIMQQGLKKSASNQDFALIEQAVDIVYQVCAQMVSTRTILAYNWTQLWKTLVLSLKYVAALESLPASLVSTVNRMLSVLVGMSLRRDLLEEEDWRALLFVVVYNATLFQELVSKFPTLAGSAPLSAAKSMTAQYELNPDQPDFTAISRQGVLVAGKNLIGEKLRPFGITCDATVKWAVKQQIIN